MYLTVQKVQAPHRGVGINGALYLHDATRNDPGWNPPDLRAVVDGNLGRQVADRADLPPGGNAVQCFLDIVGPDDLNAGELKAALDRAVDRLRDSTQLPLFTHGPIALEFRTASAGRAPRESFENLGAAALELCGTQRPAARPVPLVIIAEHDDVGWRFTMTEESQRRLRDAYGDVYIAPVRVSDDVATAFEEMYGDLFPHAAEWVTSRPRSDLLQLGGVQFHRGDQVLWAWPSSAKSG